MFAISTKFAPAEAAKSFKLILSWSVRFLVVGGGRSGSIQESYAEIANEIYKGTLSTAKELAAKGIKFVPGDKEFQEAFSTAKVSATHLARYYLRALEQKAINEPEPEFVLNEDATQITLEHIMPQKPEGNWPHIPSDVIDAMVTRLGNQALLKASQNSTSGNAPFAEKLKIYAKSGLLWTKGLAKYANWGADEINARQADMAKHVAKIWSLKVV
jgi:hypothetical protein